MNAIFVEGIEMATLMARKMNVPCFKHSDYLAVTEAAKVSSVMAKKLLMTVLKASAENNQVAIICVEDDDTGRELAKEMIADVNAKGLANVSYVYFTREPELTDVEVIDGVSLLGHAIIDQEVPFGTGTTPMMYQPEPITPGMPETDTSQDMAAVQQMVSEPGSDLSFV